MGDVSAEPSMEDILSSIKRIIAEDGDAAVPRTRRAPRATGAPLARPAEPAEPDPETDGVLELNELAPEDSPTPLVSRSAAQASRGSLDALTRMIARPDADAPAPAAGPARSLDDFVADLLRPALREWLDAHLPEIVEAMVAKEIARITGGR